MHQHDRLITISTAGSRKATRWPKQNMFWSELVDRLKTAARGSETLSEYMAMPKATQDDLKDVGGFVAGALDGERRKADNVVSRDILTLDLDNVPAGHTDNVLARLEGLGCAYAVYSTRKHEPSRPRLRAMIPLHRTCTADEYEPLARKMAELIGIELCDPTTFSASRLMYWPSCCLDSQYIYRHADKPFVDTDGVLGLYPDWRNVAHWPSVPGSENAYVKLANKQGDPLEKNGVVGAFCKTYDVYQAIDKFIPGEYLPCDTEPGRLTYIGASTVGGAVIYNDGAFLYSHHATDPCSGKLVNAFDLVRLHLYSDLDDEVKQDTPTNRMPSFKAMCERAVADPLVGGLIARERYEVAMTDFADPVEGDLDWMVKLERNTQTGAFLKTSQNVRVVLECDPLLKGRIQWDSFSDVIMGAAPLPWAEREKEEGVFKWCERDDAGVRLYVEKFLGFRSKEIISDSLMDHTARHKFDPVKDYLETQVWDGVPRLDSLYIDYFGAEDCDFIRTIARKAFVAAVARVMTPGVKFDNMAVICGRQGTGKSTFFRKMGGDWFLDSIHSFEGKEAAELIQGKWIVEIGELEAMNRAEVTTVKHFLSKCDDKYRAPYAKNTEEHPRRCIFFGTTNDHEYLRDTTGNRRFWPVNALVNKPRKSVFFDLDREKDQIWAEAVVRWQEGEDLFLDPAMEEEANARRANHILRDPLQGKIEEFLEKKIPRDWSKWDIERRRMFWGGNAQGDIELVERDKVCALEIWQECLFDSRNMSKADSHRINAIMDSVVGWDRSGVAKFGKGYGAQRGFKRI